jgi:lipopolysaccharide export system permease protein
MIKKLDRYIIGKFFGTFFFILLIIMALAVSLDLSENFKDVKAADMSAWGVFVYYYIPFMFFYAHMFSNLLIFVTVVFFTSKLANNSEIIAMMAGGMSYNRLMMPFLFCSVIVTSFTIYSNHYILPKAATYKFDFERTYIRQLKKHYDHVHKEYVKRSYVSIDYFNFEYNEARDFKLEQFDTNKNLVVEYFSSFATYNKETDTWRLNDYIKRTYDLANEKEEIFTGKTLDTSIAFNPKDIVQTFDIAANMTSPVLSTFIAEETERGSDNIHHFTAELYRRNAFPVSTFILIVIGVVFSAKKKRGGTGFNMAMALLLAVTYIFIMQVSNVAMINVGLDPKIAVWIPNMVFAPLALLAYIYKERL